MLYRYATEEDVELIYDFIMRLASYENLENEVVANVDLLKEWIFDNKKAEVIFALDENNEEVGFALFFHTFSTFLGRAGIHLEDLFVLPEYRGKGYGKFLIETLVKITKERKCGRLEWCCLDWNKPSIEFYESLGAKHLGEWMIYRLAGEDLEAL